MRIRIVGAGVMGRGIAQWAATAGHTVELCDARREFVDDALDVAREMIGRAEHRGRITTARAQAACAALTAVEAPTAPAETVDLVIEAVREDLATKTALFQQLEAVLPAHTVLTTNTSSLSVTRIAAGLADPTRLAGLHFFNPVPLMPIVEVVPTALTRQDIPPLLTDLVAGSGHTPVLVADTPGFLVNHAGRGLVTEALALLEESVSDPAGIDRVARDVLGLRMGPFALMDLTGLDTSDTVNTTIWQGFRHADRLRPSHLTETRVAAGLYGRKSGRGFYTYPADPNRVASTPAAGTRAATEPPEPAVTGDPDRPVWVAGHGSDADQLRQDLTRRGATLCTGPSDQTVTLVTTWGTTVSAAVAESNLTARHTLGVDPLSLTSSRRVLAVTPATDPATTRDARAVLARASDGGTPHPVSVVRDTAGSLAQRLLASIVSVGARIAELSIATPHDLDTAVTAALGYPAGPLAWGEQIGTARMFALQDTLYRTTGDPRYRPTRWITERAQLGLPLTAPAAALPGN